MPLDRDKRRAFVDALSRKGRRRRRHRDESPPLAASQFSLAALVLLVTLSSFVLAIFHYQSETIVSGLSRASIRLTADRHQARDAVEDNADDRSFREPTADEVVPLAATIASLVAAAALGCLVTRLHPDRGQYVVWFVTCIAALGLVASLSLDVEPLADTKLKWLRREQIAATALFCLSCLLPVGAGLGWYVKFSTTK
jgi:hypothetical protein